MAGGAHQEERERGREACRAGWMLGSLRPVLTAQVGAIGGLVREEAVALVLARVEPAGVSSSASALRRRDSRGPRTAIARRNTVVRPSALGFVLCEQVCLWHLPSLQAPPQTWSMGFDRSSATSRGKDECSWGLTNREGAGR